MLTRIGALRERSRKIETGKTGINMFGSAKPHEEEKLALTHGRLGVLDISYDCLERKNTGV